MNHVLALASAAALSVAGTPPAVGCEVALLLAIDVSGSVDAGEYRLQVEGTVAALLDPAVSDALVSGQVALAMVQWSGAGMQAVILPWQRMLTEDAVSRFALDSARVPRAFDGENTAVGDALRYGTRMFDAVADCRRQVIDISSDGPQNAGRPLAPARSEALAAGIEINAIAIEDPGQAIPITEFYRRQVIGGPGFVVTAHGHLDYADAIRAKLLREILQPGS